MALSSEFGANKTKFGHFGGKNGDLAIFHLKMAKMAIFGKKKCDFFYFLPKITILAFFGENLAFLGGKMGILAIFGDFWQKSAKMAIF